MIPSLPSHAPRPAFTKNARQIIANRMIADPQYLHLLLYGGSRSGKTFIAVRAIILRALKYPNSRHLIFRQRFNAVKQSIWYDTLPKVLEVCFPSLSVGNNRGYDVRKNQNDWFIEFPHNGSQIWFGGLDDKDRAEKILGNEYCTIFANEVSQIPYGPIRIVLTRLAQNIPGCQKKFLYDCNPPNKYHWAYMLFMQQKDPLTGQALKKAHRYGALQLNPKDNVVNIGEEYLDDILGTMTDRDRRRFLEGEFTDDADGALFRYPNLIRDRRKGFQDFDPPLSGVHQLYNMYGIQHVAIAVDPAVSAGEKSDEHGIIVVGYAPQEEGFYILGDYSMGGAPSVWAQEVDRLYRMWDADVVVGEVNNGGDLVEVNIRTVNRLLNYVSVRATKGKAIRAEPVASLSERGLFHLCGEYPSLEEELTGWVPDSGLPSPNRLDAAVWGCTVNLKAQKRIRSFRG